MQYKYKMTHHTILLKHIWFCKTLTSSFSIIVLPHEDAWVVIYTFRLSSKLWKLKITEVSIIKKNLFSQRNNSTYPFKFLDYPNKLTPCQQEYSESKFFNGYGSMKKLSLPVFLSHSEKEGMWFSLMVSV